MNVMTMRNIILFIVLCAIYATVSWKQDLFPGIYLIVLPVLIGILGYQFSTGYSFFRRLLPAFVPMAVLPVSILLLGSKTAVGISVFHSVVIGLLVVQLWEVVLWLVTLLNRKARRLG